MITFLIYLPFLLLFVVVAVYAERKISAFVQTRVGPIEVGPMGLFQTIADLLKMLQKEDIRPFAIDKFLFLVAPLIVFASIFTGFSVLPFTQGVAGSEITTGVFFLLGVISLDVLGILMAGWGSNNKFSVLGAMRAVAQIVSYEIPLGLSVLAVVMLCGTLDLQEISSYQGVANQTDSFFLGIPALDVGNIGGFLSWNIFQMPILVVAFVVFFISSLAEANRVPFDLPESESELIGGYHTEYSGFRWG
ncbi:MAG: complex I subunit 1 family protein, partial [Cyclobacteriaceae bacterium]